MRAFPVAAFLLLLAACGGDDDERAQAAARDGAAAARPPAPTLTEPQLVMAVLVADAADSAAGALALRRADAAPVRSFARAMVRDHAAINDQLSAFGTQLKLTPAESALGAQLRARGEQNLTQLQSVVPSAFDSTYLAAEIAAHRVFLNALDRHVVPSAQHPDLKVTVQNIRRAMAVHLVVAQQLQAQERRTPAVAAAPRRAPAADAASAPAESTALPRPQPQLVRPADTTQRAPLPRDTIRRIPPRDTIMFVPPPRIDTLLPPVKDTIRGRYQ